MHTLTAPTTDHTPSAIYLDQHVMILQVDATFAGTAALISYEDGAEEWIPLNTLSLIS